MKRIHTSSPIVAPIIVVLLASAALAQSSGGGASSSGSGATSAGTSASTGAGTSRSSGGAPGTAPMSPRVGTSGTSGGNDPRTLATQPATTTQPGSTAPGTYAPGTASPPPAGTGTPSGEGYPSGPALEAARQRSMQNPVSSGPEGAVQSNGTAIPPAAAGVGGDRSATSQTGDAATQQATPGLPAAPPQNPSLLDPSRLASGGRATAGGATGRTMDECEAAWDSKTHMSKQQWRESCRRTLTPPHM
jgi:hypothetical protein